MLYDKFMEIKVPVLYLIVPCYNEEPILRDSAQQFKAKLEALINAKKVTTDSRIMFIDDGSNDSTYQIITDLYHSSPLFCGLKLSRNRGQQNAMLAGLSVARAHADVTITIDADLQDDLNALDKMLDEYMNGAEIVYGVRSTRKKDTFFKRVSAHAFYKTMLRMGVDIVYDHSDFRLLSKNAMNALAEYTESNVFLRGLIPQLGFKTAKVTYPRAERQGGKSKYNPASLMSLALEGITSFSSKPLTAIFWLGFWLHILGLIGFVTTMVLMFTLGLHFMWTLLSAMVWLTGLLLIALGIIGFYLGKTYLETKHRPRFIIEEILDQ